MKRTKKCLSLLLVLLMLGAVVLTACDKETAVSYTDPAESTSGGTTEPEDTEPKLTGEHALLIENAKRLENGVNTYYTDGSRTAYIAENKNMAVECALVGDGKMITSLKNPQGGAYIENTSDVYVKTANGTYFASGSSENARANLFRFGYYYYDVRILGQSFNSSSTVIDERELPLKAFNKFTDVKGGKLSGGVLKFTVTSVIDPSVGSSVDFEAEDYNAIEITLKSSGSANGYLYVGCPDLTGDNMIPFNIINDGEYHTYRLELNDITLAKYEGKCANLRIDVSGIVGEQITLSKVKLLKVDTGDAPALCLDRNLNVYSDKLHQVIHIVAPKTVSGIEEIGIVTRIKADTVDKLIIKDEGGTHTEFAPSGHSGVAYAGFDVKGAGVFGYILPSNGESGTMSVALEDGYYVITQISVPENNTVYKSNNESKYDFYMGHRLYTDTSHDFEAFLLAAEAEINPLTDENITVDKEKTPEGEFAGYDAMRGYYTFTLPGTAAFSDSYFTYPNRHYGVAFNIKGDRYDRTLYVQTFADSTNIECAALLSDKDLMLPVAIEVAKNFSYEDEEPLFDNGDNRYSETYFPVTVKAEEDKALKLLNLYQNWGVHPLKQVSSIQFYMPYYHLSTGTTETNCIAPYYVNGKNLLTLPDHRAMSAPFWFDIPSHSGGSQPQHTSGGMHSFLKYTDSSGKYSASELTGLNINSYGPTYASVDNYYISDDGRIKMTYVHEEMPQTDENRTYYTMTYEVLEDISFNDFRSDFSFYTVAGYGEYGCIGYLDNNNQSQVDKANATTDPVFYTLGDQFPYFDMYKLISGTVDDYVNVAFLVKDYEFVIGGARSDAALAIKSANASLSLSLDLGKVDLKKGDTFKITAIIMPWGSQLLDYSGDAPDKNVRDVRENSLINPCKVEAEVGTVKETEFVPSVISDGKTATFTISGGHNNMAVRVYGFDMLTAPVIEELVDGQWVTYTVNSSLTPDKTGYNHYYDGYTVYYDGDGTFSYAFIIPMDNGNARTFRITADKEFEAWPPETELKQEGNDSTLDVYVSAKAIANNTVSASGFESITLSEDEQYVTFKTNGSVPEAYINVYTEGVAESGQYVVVRYRLRGLENSSGTNYMEVFTSTENSSATGNGDWLDSDGIIKDGQWHIIVFDIEAARLRSFAKNDDGKYVAKFVRLDVFNRRTPATAEMDIAYVGMCNSLDDVKEMAKDIGEFTVTSGIGDGKKTVIEAN